MHYSRIMPGYDANSRYLPSTAVLLNELFKLLFCFAVSVKQVGFKTTWVEVFSADSWKLAIPAFLYTLQNSLQYTAVSNLDAATFQVTYQLKILTTAFFSVSMLGRTLSRNQWVSLFLLTIGIALVQVSPEAFSSLYDSVISTFLPGAAAPDLAPITDAAKNEGVKLLARAVDHAATEAEMNRGVGLIAVSVACCLSGLAGVYFEKVLKGSNASLWVRNIQLSFYSLFPALFIGVLFKDGAQISEKGFFFGYNSVVWTAIFFQAFGGIVVALCVKFADNIAKNFATSISILISFLASVYFFNFNFTLNFILGSGIVIFATYLYAKPDAPPKDFRALPLSEEPSDNNKRE